MKSNTDKFEQRRVRASPTFPTTVTVRLPACFLFSAPASSALILILSHQRICFAFCLSCYCYYSRSSLLSGLIYLVCHQTFAALLCLHMKNLLAAIVDAMNETSTKENTSNTVDTTAEAEETIAKLALMQIATPDNNKQNPEIPTAVLDHPANDPEVVYLRKETLRKIRNQNAQLRADLDIVKENNQRLMDANASAGTSFATLSQHAKNLNQTNAKLAAEVQSYKQQVQQMNIQQVEVKEELKMKQATYIAEVHSRLRYQKAMAAIVELVQEKCRDSRLVEQVLTIADDCEAAEYGE
jgi:hypothetical protein